MNALAPLSFASAYRQLRPLEKQFVDRFVDRIETDAARANEPIRNALHKPIPSEIADAAGGMLDKPLVRAAITERINEIAAENDLNVHKILKEWKALAFSSVADFFHVGEDGFPVFDFTRATPEQLKAISSFDIEYLPRGGMKMKFRLHDKTEPLKVLSKFVGILDADNPHWRAMNAVPIDAVTLPAETDERGAADAYARMVSEEP